MLSYSYLIRFLFPETVQAIYATKITANNGSLWKALLSQYQSQQKHTLREIHKQSIKIGIKRLETLVSYQGRAQQRKKRLNGTIYKVPDAHKWVLLTKGLLEVHKPSVRLIIMTFQKYDISRIDNKIKEAGARE